MINSDVGLEPGQDSYVFAIQGHERRYHLTDVQSLYGATFCERFEKAWNRIFCLQPGATSYATFKRIRPIFLRIAVEGIKEPESAFGRVFASYRDRPHGLPSQTDWDEVLEFFRGIFSNVRDSSFINSESLNSRNKYVETINSGLEYLHQAGFVRRGRVEHRFKYIVAASQVETIAGLMVKAGRLKLSGLSEAEAAKQFIRANNTGLLELRRCLSKDFEDEWATFQHGQTLMSDQGLPTIEAVAARLKDIPFVEVNWLGQQFELSPEQCRGFVAHLVSQVLHYDLPLPIPEKKYRALINSVGGDAAVQRLIEGTSVALHAAFHILMIDTELKSQPLKDFPADPFVSKVIRGKRQVQTLEGKKNRALGKSVEGHISNVSARSGEGGVSGELVIERWVTMSQPLRNRLPPEIDTLWVFRKATDREPRIKLGSVESEWRAAFQNRIKSNPLIGGLPITAHVIIRSCRNRRGADGEFDFEIQKALANHDDAKTTYHYLDRNAVRKLLENAIRRFLDSWEASAASTIEDGARLLGIAEEDFDKRRQLGLENGLSFAAVLRSAKDEIVEEDDQSVSLPEHLRSFHSNAKSLQNLILVRTALYRHMDEAIVRNPARFVRVWIDWLAVVEGYCILVQKSRLRREFDVANDNVLLNIESGKLRVPLVW
ncbi:hypothetical protein [Ensifer adhaerens]|uniref:hypothetical protein n=1 Tax=Ensifer adhaerens TaxID=106592 RepID=UPI00132E86D6|nr:hypothetical protein [Ensifer adhaerens]QHG71517.1 hypothetical protein DQW09_17435 [Ensifer adhaerens]